MGNTPNIRFKGFTDDWEQRKLGDICSRVQGNDGRMELPTLTISAANGWMKQEDRFSGNIAGKEQTNYTLLHKGELSYNHGNSKLAKYGTVFSLQTYEEALVPRVYHSFKVENGSADFIEYYFATKIPDRELRKLISSGARMDGLLNIGYDDFMGIKMMFPSASEQDKIAEYYRALDHLITLHQRKSFLNFAKRNDWEQRKFGSLLKEIREKTKIENEDTLLSCAIDGMYLNSELFSHFRGSSNIGYLKVKKNDLILSAQNLHLGNCNVNLRFEHGIISPAYKVYELVTCDPFFIQAWVKQDSTKDFFLNASTEGASVCRKNIVWEELYKQTLPIPKLKEQEQIGQYFNELDNLITLHRRAYYNKKGGLTNVHNDNQQHYAIL